MKNRSIIVSLILTIVFASSYLAAEKFLIPKEHHKSLVGTWKVVSGKVLLGEKEKPLPLRRQMRFLFRKDGSGIQFKGKREIPITWGAGEKGKFAFQWKQEGGNGDGIMGTWKFTKEALVLHVTECEDGKQPEGDKLILILKRN